jgi:hypothetical protein
MPHPRRTAFSGERENVPLATWSGENDAGTVEWERVSQAEPWTAPAEKRPGPRLPDGWRETVLQAIRDVGGYYRSARMAGISPATFFRHLDADREFATAVQSAREEHADKLEAELAAMGRAKGNPVSHIVLLKKYRPLEYIEKQATLSLNVTTELTPELGADLLREMLSQATPATRAILDGRVLEAQGEDVTP